MIALQPDEGNGVTRRLGWSPVQWVLALATPFALWMVLGVTAATTGSQSLRENSMAWWPFGTHPREDQAIRLLQSAAADAKASQAAAASREVLIREPANVQAARTLGLALAMQGRNAAADAALRYAERLSRRDLATEMWLIEQAVSRGEIGAALVHYDRALRVHADAVELLVPTLVAASSEPAVAGSLATLLAQRPLWWPSFIDALQQSPGNGRALALSARALRLSARSEVERNLLDRILTTLVERGRVPEALALYTAQRPGSTVATRLARLAVEEPMGPFDWTLIDDPGFGAVVEDRNGHDVLVLTAQSGRGGTVARQTVPLAPGRYALTARVGGRGATGPQGTFRLVCADGRVLAQARWPGSVAARRIEIAAFVSTACMASRVEVDIAPGDDAASDDLWIANVAIRPSLPAARL